MKRRRTVWRSHIIQLAKDSHTNTPSCLFHKFTAATCPTWYTFGTLAKRVRVPRTAIERAVVVPLNLSNFPLANFSIFHFKHWLRLFAVYSLLADKYKQKSADIYLKDTMNGSHWMLHHQKCFCTISCHVWPFRCMMLYRMWRNAECFQKCISRNAVGQTNG